MIKTITSRLPKMAKKNFEWQRGWYRSR